MSPDEILHQAQEAARAAADMLTLRDVDTKVSQKHKFLSTILLYHQTV